MQKNSLEGKINYKKMLGVSLIALVFLMSSLVLLAAPVQADGNSGCPRETLFEDDFELGQIDTNKWSIEGDAALTDQTVYEGSYSLQLDGGADPDDTVISTTISTLGYKDIKLSYYRLLDSLEDDNGFVSEYTIDGSTWTELENVYGDDDTFTYHQFDLTGAENLGEIAIRLSVYGGADNDLAVLDLVEVTGEPIDCEAPTMEPIAEPENECYNEAPVFSNFGFDDNVDLFWARYCKDGYSWHTIFGPDYSGDAYDDDGWELPIFDSLSEGEHTIKFEVRDDFDNTNTYSWVFFKDTTPPEVEITYGNPNIEVDGEFGILKMIGDGTPVTLTVTDPNSPCCGSGVCTLWVSNNNGPQGMVPVQDGDPLDETGPEPDGEIVVSFSYDDDCWHQIDYRAVDCCGNYEPSPTGHKGEDFYVDATKPTTNTEIVGPSDPIEGTPYSWFGRCTTKWLNVTDDGCQGGAGVKFLYINVYLGTEDPQYPGVVSEIDWEPIPGQFQMVIPDNGAYGEFADQNMTEGVISVPFHFSEDCWHMVEHWGVDAVGNEEIVSPTSGTKQVHKVDATPPESSLEFEGCIYQGDLGTHVSLETWIDMIIDNVGTEPCIYPETMGFFRIFVEEEGRWYPDENTGEGSYYLYDSNDVFFWKDTYWYKYDDCRSIKFTEECHHILEYFAKDPLCNTEETHVVDFYVDDGIPYADLTLEGHGYYEDLDSGKSFIKAGKEFTINGHDLPNTDCAAGIEYVFWRYDFEEDSYPMSAGTGVITGAELASLYGYEDADIIGYDWFMVPGDTATVKFDEKCEHHLYYFVKDRVCHHSPVYDKLFYVDEEKPTTDGYTYPDHGYLPADDGNPASKFYLKEDTSIFLYGSDLLDGDCSAGIESIFFRYEYGEGGFYPPEIIEDYGYEIVTGAELNTWYGYTSDEITSYQWFRVDADTAEVWFEEQCTHYLYWFIKDNVCHRSDVVDYKIYVDATEPDTWLDIPNEHGFYVDDENVKHIKENFVLTLYAQEIHQCASGIESIFFRYDYDEDSYPLNIGDTKYGATAIDGADLVTDYGADYDIPEITDYIWFRIDNTDQIDIWFEEQCVHDLHWFVKDNVCHRTDIYDETFEVDATAPTSDWTSDGQHGIYYDNDKIILKEGKHITLNAYDDHDCTAGIESIFFRYNRYIDQTNQPTDNGIEKYGAISIDGATLPGMYGDAYDDNDITEFYWYRIDGVENVDVWFEQNCRHHLYWFVKDNVCHRSDIYDQLFFVDAEIPEVSINWPSGTHGYYMDDMENYHLKVGKPLTISAEDFPDTDCMAGIECIFFRYDYDGESYPINVGDQKYGATAINGADLPGEYGSDYDISAITGYNWYRINADQVDVWFEEECMHTLHFFAKDNVCHRTSLQKPTYYVDGTGPELEFTYPDHGYVPIDDNSGYLKVNTDVVVTANDLPENDCEAGIESIFWRYEYEGISYPRPDWQYVAETVISGQQLNDRYGYADPSVVGDISGDNLGLLWYVVNEESEDIGFPDQCQHDLYIFAKDNVCNRGDVLHKTYYVDGTEPDTWLYADGHGYFTDCIPQEGGGDVMIGTPMGVPQCTSYIKAGKHFTLNATDEHDCAAGIEGIFFRYVFNGDNFPPEDNVYGYTVVSGQQLFDDYGYTDTDIVGVNYDLLWYFVPSDVADVWFEEQCQHHLYWFAKDNVCQKTDVHYMCFNVDDTDPTANLIYPQDPCGHYYDDAEDKHYISCDSAVSIHPDDTHPCSAGIESTFWRYEFEGTSYPNAQTNPHGYLTVTGDELIDMYGDTYDTPDIQPYTWYRFDAEHPIMATFFEDCTHELYYFVKDNVCHHSEVYNETIYVDCAPPNSEKEIDEPKWWDEEEGLWWVTSDTNFSITSEDYEQDCEVGVEYLVIEVFQDCYNGSWGQEQLYDIWTINDGSDDDLLIEEDGIIRYNFTLPNEECWWKIRWQAVDKLCNAEEWNNQYHIVDNTPPHLVILKPSDGWYSDGETIPATVLGLDINNPHSGCMMPEKKVKIGDPRFPGMVIEGFTHCAVGIEDGAQGYAWLVDITPDFLNVVELETENFVYDADAHEFIGGLNIPHDSGLPDGTVLLVVGANDTLGNSWNTMFETLHWAFAEAKSECQDQNPCLDCIVDFFVEEISDFITDQNIVFIGIDNTPPEVEIIEPVEMQDIGLGPFHIKVNISDNLTGIKTGEPVYVKLGGIEIGTLYYDSEIGGAEGDLDVPLNVASGEQELKVTAADEAGTLGYDNITVIVGKRPGPLSTAADVQPDPSKLLIPEEGEDLIGQTLTVTGTIHSIWPSRVVMGAEFFISPTIPDEDTHVGSIAMTPAAGYSWGEDQVNVEGTFDTTGMEPGTYTVWVRGVDQYGSWGTFDEEEFNLVLETHWRPVYCEILMPEEDEEFTVEDCATRYVEVQVDVHYWDDWSYSDMDELIGNVQIWLDDPYGAPDQYYEVEYNRYGGNHFWADIPVYMYKSGKELDLQAEAQDQYGNKQDDDVRFSVITSVEYDRWLEEGWNYLGDLGYLGCSNEVEHVFASVRDDIDYVFEKGTWDNYNFGEGGNTLTEINKNNFYWVKMKNAARFFVDSECPIVTISEPTGEINDQCFDVEGYACDTGTGVKEVMITIMDEDECCDTYWNGTAWVETETYLTCSYDEGTLTWDYIEGVDLTYKHGEEIIITAYATDYAGCTCYATSTFYFNDIGDPTVGIVNPEEMTYDCGEPSVINGYAYDGECETDVSHVTISIRENTEDEGTTYRYWDGDSWETTETELMCTYDPITDGWEYTGNLPNWENDPTYTIFAYAYDLASNMGIAQVDFDYFCCEVPEFTNLNLLQNTDMELWDDVVKLDDYIFTMCLNPINDYHYIDIDNIYTTTNTPLAAGEYGFYLDTDNLPEGFYTYWAGRGVYEGCPAVQGYEPAMWDIINGTEPMFYLSVDGLQNMMLVDGLQKHIGHGDNPLRVNGEYPTGSYNFTGTVIADCGEESEPITINMIFENCCEPELTVQKKVWREDMQAWDEYTEAEIGDIVTFNITIHIPDGACPLYNGYLEDLLPYGFDYIEDSTSILGILDDYSQYESGADVEPQQTPSGDDTLLNWTSQEGYEDAPAGMLVYIEFEAEVTACATGTLINEVNATGYYDCCNTISEEDTAEVMVVCEGPDLYDFGDAPYNGDNYMYPTLLANNGAKHTIDELVYLGEYIDDEQDGQPTTPADGDDNNNLDDEDGVDFTSTIVIGQTASVVVNASTSGFLDAWIDFDKSGNWSSDEKIFDHEPLVAGDNALNFNVPGSTYCGQTYARFRFNTIVDTGLECYGHAPDGEVEDYLVTIQEEQSVE